jgi:hypothetical protein
MANSTAPVLTSQSAPAVRKWTKRIIAGNPFYLLSAGLLLYGINLLTTDPKLVGAEFSMLRFNFCALVIYELMLVTTAIALARRRIWYDALLLVGLSNVFVIVPFSLISRAVFLNSKLALVMSAIGALLAVGKFWAFKRYMPGLRLPGRLLAFGAVLLLANAVAPLLFKAIATEPARIKETLDLIWMVVLPVLAGLANLLPKPLAPGVSPGEKHWLPLTFYLAWIAVTGFHLAGIGYALTFEWSLPLLVPIAWVMSWTIYLRKKDFMQTPRALVEQTLLFNPLLLPLLAVGNASLFLLFASLNFICYLVRFILNQGSRLALVQLLGAAAILLSGLPAAWLVHVVPGISRVEWIVGSTVLCFFWLIFLSRDPRLAMLAVISLVALCFFCATDFTQLTIQFGLVSLLAHSLRWEDRMHKGAALLRIVAGVLWVFLSISWLRESTPKARVPVYIAASVLLIAYGIYAAIHYTWKPWVIPVFAIMVLASEPGSQAAGDLTDISPGFLAIGASFLLFALGSLAAFSKNKKNDSGVNPNISCRI